MTGRATPMTISRLGTLGVVALALVASGCNIPNFQGPQVQTPPPAFTLNREVTQDRRMFPARAVVHHDAWVEASWGNFSGLYINGHLGVLGVNEVEAALRASKEAAAGQRVTFGDIESLVIDGRAAHGWGETWRLENGGLQYVVFRAAIPYDTITYAVDFLTGDPGLKIRPDSLRTIVASFAIGKTTWNTPLLMVLAGVLLLVGNTVRSRRKERLERHRNIPLATLPKVPEPDDKAAPQPPAGGDSIAQQIAKRLEDKQGPGGGPSGA